MIFSFGENFLQEEVLEQDQCEEALQQTDFWQSWQIVMSQALISLGDKDVLQQKYGLTKQAASHTQANFLQYEKVTQSCMTLSPG